SHQETAVALARELDEDAQALARRLTASNEFDEYQRFVDAYVRDQPLASLEFVRPSVIELWSAAHGGGARLVDSMGTIPEAMTDVSDRLKMSSDALALQTLWRTQLALREAGYSGDDIRAALRQLDERLATASQAAEHAPQLLHETIGEVRRSVLDVLARVDSSSARMIEALRTEREALTADVRVERQVLVAAADGERRARSARPACDITVASNRDAGRVDSRNPPASPCPPLPNSGRARESQTYVHHDSVGVHAMARGVREHPVHPAGDRAVSRARHG